MNKFCELVGVRVPVICGAMYPCSNPELIAAASAAGGIGIVQPLSLTYVHGYDFRAGIKYIRTLTDKPIGLNLLIEQSSEIYLKRMREYLQIALDENIKFFVSALGNPDWVVKAVHAKGGIVFHDVTAKKWALKAKAAGVDGLICVNARAGGHAGTETPERLFADLESLGLPLVCAGGVGDEQTYKKMLNLGYVAVQMGTRFLASVECKIDPAYKQAIIDAEPQDVVLSEKITGVPVAVINNEYVQRVGTKASWLARQLLGNPRTKHWMRLLYSLISFRGLKTNLQSKDGRDYYWQAGKSVGGITKIESVATIIERFSQV